MLRISRSEFELSEVATISREIKKPTILPSCSAIVQSCWRRLTLCSSCRTPAADLIEVFILGRPQMKVEGIGSHLEIIQSEVIRRLRPYPDVCRFEADT